MCYTCTNVSAKIGLFLVELARFFGFLHPALIHFPLTLLLLSVSLELIGFVRRNARFTWAAQTTLLLGTAATLFAFVAGNFAEIWAARSGLPQDPMEFHELLATITSWSFVFLTATRLFLGAETNRRWMTGYLIAAILCCGLLVWTGHQGAMLVYEHGAGVHVAGIGPRTTHEDLAILLQKQDPEALLYSNFMHHVFGWMVMILSVMLLVDMISPVNGEKLRRAAPVLLIAGGIFLMTFSDQDAWPLYVVRPFRPWSDKEVLMHKTYAVLMLLAGLRGIWKRRGDNRPSRNIQSRMMAIFALVGGALLFTHVHSNAPYANVAAGVYIHHTVMGLFALSIGTVKLIEDRMRQMTGHYPEPSLKLARLARGLGWTYAGLMLVEAILLVNYNEGLPWFLGYRNLSLTAPHRGLIAPLGSRRAELCYDPDAQRFDLYLYEQASNKAAAMVAQSVQTVVRVGSDTTACSLSAAAGDASHYTGQANFLKGITMFEATALVWPRAERPESPPLKADFEPWIDREAARPHTRLAWVCPMHAAQGASQPGACPRCGMALVPNGPPRPWPLLHDPDKEMDLTLTSSSRLEQVRGAIQVASTHPVQWTQREKLGSQNSGGMPIVRPLPGQKVRLTLKPHRSNGEILRDLEVVHTKRMHLIVASEDLSFFDHIHPVPQLDGTLVLDYTFPRSGRYALYADITPKGERNQVFSMPVEVAGQARPKQPLILTPAEAKVFGDYRVQLRMNPDPPLHKDETSLTFLLSKNGLPVIDLAPFLGAGGHCVILSEDGKIYLHSHPLEAEGSRFGPAITFHTLFPRSGIYKIWAQFQHQGKPITFDFVVKVE